jgi:hypothetical protein
MMTVERPNMLVQWPQVILLNIKLCCRRQAAVYLMLWQTRRDGTRQNHRSHIELVPPQWETGNWDKD